jgi:hypothetical protein
VITAIQIGDIALGSDGHYALTRASGLGLPPIRSSAFNLAGANFGRFVAAFYGARRFSFDGTVIGDTVADYASRRSLVQQAFDAGQGEQLITFTLSDGRSLTLQAVTVECDFPLQAGWPSAGQFHVEPEAAYPFYEAASPTSLTLTLQTGGGGTVPPPTMPMGLAMGSGGTAITTSNGTTTAAPTFRIVGPVTNPTLRNNTTGQQLRFLHTLAAGEYLDIDVRNKTVHDQAGTNRYAAKDGDWWGIEPGNNELAFLADSSAPLATATITYADTYLAL